MNWTKGKNKYLMFCFFLLVSCHKQSEKDIITGIWKFKSITNNAKMAIRVTEEDFLKLNPDSTFTYELNFINKKKMGRWEYANHKLLLNYINPDTMRTFDIEIINKKELVFSENNVEFRFLKE